MIYADGVYLATRIDSRSESFPRVIVGLPLRCEACTDCAMNFFQNFSQTVAKFPDGIVFLEFSHVADPPEVVADPVRLFIAPGQFTSTYFLT